MSSGEKVSNFLDTILFQDYFFTIIAYFAQKRLCADSFFFELPKLSDRVHPIIKTHAHSTMGRELVLHVDLSTKYGPLSFARSAS